MGQAAKIAIQPKRRLAKASPFAAYVINLHDSKSAAYGDSWCRRGEQMSIIPNIARKVDRLESQGETDDETQLDTAIDLLVYTAKYQAWLDSGVSDDSAANSILLGTDGILFREADLARGDVVLRRQIVDAFEVVVKCVQDPALRPSLPAKVQYLLNLANLLARSLWGSL